MADLLNTHENCDCYSPCGPCGPCNGNCYYDEDDIIVIPNKASQFKSFFDKCKNIFGRKLPTIFCERLTSYNTNNEKLKELQEVQESQNIINQEWILSKPYNVDNSTFYSTPRKPPHTKNKTINKINK